MFAPNQERPIASRAWISAGPTVGINDHFQIGNFGEVNMLIKSLDEIMRRLRTKTKLIVDSLEEGFGICAKELNGNGEQNDTENFPQHSNSGITK